MLLLLCEEDIQVLFEKDLLGSSTVEALLNTVWFNNTIHFGILGCKKHKEMCSRGEVKLCQNFHRAGVPRIQWKRNQNSFRKRSTECKSHCTENFCCAEQPGMSSKGLQSLRRKRPAEMKTDDAPFLIILFTPSDKGKKSGVLVVRGNRTPQSLLRERKRYHCTTRLLLCLVYLVAFSPCSDKMPWIHSRK